MSVPTKHLKVFNQEDRYSSPWSISTRLLVLLWHITWLVLFRPTPKHFYRWRILLLRLFGCCASGTPYVAPSAIIKMPWNLTLEDRACLGPNSEVYNLGQVTIRAHATVSQQAYLCTGTHDFSLPNTPLVVGQIEIGQDAFIGARAFILPGISIGQGAIVGACAVVTKSVPPRSVVAGNPARFIKNCSARTS